MQGIYTRIKAKVKFAQTAQGWFQKPASRLSTLARRDLHYLQSAVNMHNHGIAKFAQIHLILDGRLFL